MIYEMVFMVLAKNVKKGGDYAAVKSLIKIKKISL